MGTLQATEVIKEILGLGNSLAGKLLIYDALGPTFRRINVPRDPDCKVCGSVLRIGAA
jgi:adenylyltransferase/sulfurtransferase